MQIKDLKQDRRNYRKHNQRNLDLIKKSVTEVGLGRSVVIDNENEIVCGNGLVSTLDKNTPIKVIETDGSELVVVKRTDLATNDDKRKQLAIMDNSTSESSEWDFEKLEADFDAEELEDWGLDVDFAIEEEEKEVIEDEVPEEVETRCKKGDIWQLGEHRLMCGDSTKVDDVEKLMNGGKADMVFTDPPYGNGASGKYGRGHLGIRTIKNDEDLSCFNSFISIMPCDKIIYFLQWRTLSESLQTIKNKGLKINTVGVWDKKQAGLNGSGGISEQWEAIVFAGNIKYKKFGGNVFTVPREHYKREESLHPHIKPQELIKQIFDFTDGVSVVLDVFGGSGSTLIACEQLNRKCYTMELDEHYCDVIITRWENLTGKKAVKID